MKSMTGIANDVGPSKVVDLFPPKPTALDLAAQVHALRLDIEMMREQLKPLAPSLLITGQLAMDEYRRVLWLTARHEPVLLAVK